MQVAVLLIFLAFTRLVFWVVLRLGHRAHLSDASDDNCGEMGVGAPDLVSRLDGRYVYLGYRTHCVSDGWSDHQHVEDGTNRTSVLTMCRRKKS